MKGHIDGDVNPPKRLVSFAVNAVLVRLNTAKFEYCNAGNSLIDTRIEFFKHFINYFGCSSQSFSAKTESVTNFCDLRRNNVN